MWIRSQLEIFLTQMFPNFPELTRLEIGTCNPKCEMLEQISKRWCENNFVFLLEGTDSIQDKITTQHPDKKNSLTPVKI